MLGWIERRRAVRRSAEALMQAMPGREAWLEARARGREMERDEDDRAHWWCVAALIERRVGIEREGQSGFVPPI